MRDTLLRRGARIGLLEALMLGDDARVDALLNQGGLPEITPNGGSILAFARTTHAIDRLLALGANTDTKDRWGSAPIDAMSRLGATGQPLVAHLVTKGVTASPADYARMGDLETIQRLVAADAPVARLESVMMCAVEFRHHDLVQWLLQHGGNANARDDARSKPTALHSAAWNGDLRMAQMLVAAGANPAAHDEQYDATPAGFAETALEITNNPKCAEVAKYLRSLV